MAETAEDQREFASLIERICRSKEMQGADKQEDLLQFLFRGRQTPLEARDIEIRHYGYAAVSREHNPSHARNRVKDLRERLGAFNTQARGEKWRCDVKTVSTEGYQLIFIPWFISTVATEAFWKTELFWNEKLAVVCDALLFFYDVDEHKAFRYVDTNVDSPGSQKAKAELRHRHPDAYDDKLVASHLYVDVGTIHASERLRRSLAVIASYDPAFHLTNEFRSEMVMNSSVILVGNLRSNPFIREFFASEDGQHFAFRLNESRTGILNLRGLNENELAMIPKACIVDNADDSVSVRSGTEMSFGVVTRAPNPSRKGSITIFSSDTTMNIAKMAECISDETRMENLLRCVGWSNDKERPRNFELLFKSKLSPGGLYDQASEAELIAWR